VGNLGFDIEEENEETPVLPVPSTSPFSLACLDLPSPGMWPPRLSFDVALGVEDEETIRERYGMDAEEFAHIMAQPAFRVELATHYSVLRETGATFAVKAKLIAEEKLQEMYEIISSKLVDAKVRMETWRAVVKAAGLEEKAGAGINANAQTVNIQINY
jgi:hypothetical protein